MRWLRRLPVIILVMSVPLFFSYRLKRPPAFLTGMPFATVWTWGIAAAVLLPMLLIVETATCAKLLSNRTKEGPSLAWHAAALFTGIASEAIFIMARRSSL
jgi:hypothetical protein